MNNQINFTGTFVLRRPNKTAKDDLREILSNKRGIVIIDNFDGKKNSLYVLNNKNDKFVADYVIKNKLNFDYYQAITTGNIQKTTKKQKILNILNTHKDEKIKSLITLQKLFSDKTGTNSKNLRYQQAIERTFKALELEQTNYNIGKLRGAIIVSDKKGKTVARISPVSQFGITFAHIEPKISDYAPLRYAINESGEIIHQYKTLQGAEQFQKSFANAVEFNR